MVSDDALSRVDSATVVVATAGEAVHAQVLGDRFDVLTALEDVVE